MKLELKNEAVLVKYDGRWDLLCVEERAARSGIILPEALYGVDVDPTQISMQALPVLYGEVVDIGPGRKLTKMEGRQMPPDLAVGQKILFQVGNQITYKDKKTASTFYLIGVGNILATLEG